MSFTCLRCLRQSLNQVEASLAPNGTSRAAFSTTSSLSAKKKTANVQARAPRAGSTLRLAKKTHSNQNARPPAVGERRALRKRVVLSNTNALAVAGLQDLAKEHVFAQRLREHQDKVLGFHDNTVDALRALEAFKPTQGWSLYRRPASLVRAETVELATDFEWVAQSEQGRTVRKVLFGERGSGKSVLQLQALAMASLKRWIVVHIPEAKDLTNAHTAYQPMSAGASTIYIQPEFTAKLLDNINKANQNILSNLRLSKRHDLPIPIQPGTSLASLLEIGAVDPDLAWPVWQAFWSEVLAPSAHGDGLQRPPVLFALDGVDHVMRLSAYLNADMEPIHAHELALVRDFIHALSGVTGLPNGGMVLAATSESNRAAAHTLDHALIRNHSLQSGQTPPDWNPYTTYDKWVQQAMETVGAQKLTGLSKEEARGIMEYYAQSGLLRQTVTDGLVSEKWTLAGRGNIGQIERGTVRARF